MNRWVKRIGYGFAAIIACLVVATGVVYAMSESRFRQTHTVAAETVPVPPTDSQTLARGAHLATVVGCTDCHGEGLRGTLIVDAFPLGRLGALNLTRGAGGVGAQLTPEVIERAVRHGVGHDGRALRIMPSDEFQEMSDEDLRAVTAYVLHVAPVNNVLPASYILPLPRALMLAGAMPLLPIEKVRNEPHAATVSQTPSKEYGLYLANLAGCRGCHGDGLSGGKIPAGDPSWVPAANLTRQGVAGTWSEADFVRTMRTGKRPDGSALKAPMPWKNIGLMSDDELHALWLYLQSVPPRAFGNH